jgi:peptidoglycan/LPS O-acetylase OafA/YrhL
LQLKTDAIGPARRRGEAERVFNHMTPATSNQAGSKALDQWRGLALVLVLISHGFHATGRVEGLGRVGVNLFFFISGILVFRSLDKSRTAGSWARSFSFWHRRFRRLYPALLAYTLVVVLGWTGLQFLHIPRFDRGYDNFLTTLPSAVFYYTNYVPEMALVLGHLWSLSCEMQFYLLAPIIYLAGGTTAGRRNLIFGGLLLVLVALGAAEPFALKNPFSIAKYHFEFAVWPMMLGFFCEYTKNRFMQVPARLVFLIVWFTPAICAACLVPMLMGNRGKVLVVASGALLLLPCFLTYVSGKPVEHRVGGVFRWLGARTYSIYLWQQPFTICYFLPPAWWPAGALISIGLGNVWFRWFELPFLSDSRKTAGGRA